MEYYPVAVGKMLTKANWMPTGLKGRAIQIEHYLFDKFWEMGP